MQGSILDWVGWWCLRMDDNSSDEEMILVIYSGLATLLSIFHSLFHLVFTHRCHFYAHLRGKRTEVPE